jgi:hypothetical protein
MANSQAKYTLEDLKINAQNKNYHEFFSHALDVAPSKRTSDWNKMVKSMGNNLADEAIKQQIFSEKKFALLTKIGVWPSLKMDTSFVQKFHRVQIKFYRQCILKNLPDSEEFYHLCLNTILQNWNSENVSQKLSWEMAKQLFQLQSFWNKNQANLVWRKPFHELIYLFIANNIKQGASDYYCQQNISRFVIWEKLNLILDQKNLNSQKFDEAMARYWNRNCWDSFKAHALSHITSLSTFYRSILYQFINYDQSISLAHKDFVYFYYLLDHPKKSATFNYAWNNLQNLATQLARRERVIEKIKRLDPIPDQVFSIRDEKKKLVILKTLDRKFPEFLKYYTDTCVRYLKGTGDFPQGNPTGSCQHFHNLLDNLPKDSIISINPSKIAELKQALHL